MRRVLRYLLQLHRQLSSNALNAKVSPDECSSWIVNNYAAGIQPRSENSVGKFENRTAVNVNSKFIDEWKRDTNLRHLIASKNIEGMLKNRSHYARFAVEARSILGAMDYYDSFTLSACLRGFLDQADSDLNDQRTDMIDMLDNLLDDASLYGSPASIELHELVTALHATSLHSELQSIWQAWKWTGIVGADDSNRMEQERKFLLICIAFSDWFSDSGDLASVVYITKKVFQLGIHHQSSYRLFQFQIKASGNSFNRYSPVMSLKQMKDKQYNTKNGQTISVFMRSMSDSRRWHAVYSIYKESILDGLTPTVEMVECMGDALIKECILEKINIDASFEKNTFSCFTPYLDSIVNYSTNRSRCNQAHNAKTRWIKQPAEKYHVSMFKFIFSQLKRYNFKNTPRTLAIELLYGLLTSQSQFFYRVLTIASSEQTELKRKDGPDWNFVWIILYKWSLEGSLPMINPKHIQELAEYRGFYF